MTAALSPVTRDLLAWLQERPAAGEGSLKSWGQGRRPQLTLTQVEVRAAELVDANLVTREVKADGRSVYRAKERAPEPAPVEVTTEPEPEWIPSLAPVEPFYGVDRSPEPAPVEVVTEPEPSPAPCAECARMAEALRSWERQWGPEGTDLAAMEARVQTAEQERDEALEVVAALTRDLDEARAVLAKTKAPASAEPALSALARLPAEQRRIVGLALQELSLEALGGALGAARAEAFAARPDLAPRLSENATAVLEILSPDRGQTPREIGKKAGINQHSVHSALRSLEKRGLATNATYGFWRRAKP